MNTNISIALQPPCTDPRIRTFIICTAVAHGLMYSYLTKYEWSSPGIVEKLPPPFPMLLNDGRRPMKLQALRLWPLMAVVVEPKDTAEQLVALYGKALSTGCKAKLTLAGTPSDTFQVANLIQPSPGQIGQIAGTISVVGAPPPPKYEFKPVMLDEGRQVQLLLDDQVVALQPEEVKGLPEPLLVMTWLGSAEVVEP